MCETDEFDTNFHRKQVYFRGNYQNPLVQTGLGFVPFEKKELEDACMHGTRSTGILQSHDCIAFVYLLRYASEGVHQAKFEADK